MVCDSPFPLLVSLILGWELFIDLSLAPKLLPLMVVLYQWICWIPLSTFLDQIWSTPCSKIFVFGWAIYVKLVPIFRWLFMPLRCLGNLGVWFNSLRLVFVKDQYSAALETLLFLIVGKSKGIPYPWNFFFCFSWAKSFWWSRRRLFAKVFQAGLEWVFLIWFNPYVIILIKEVWWRSEIHICLM